jgi:ubiquinone/menaquinone biosynthesis C-methylase UbiE
MENTPEERGSMSEYTYLTHPENVAEQVRLAKQDRMLNTMLGDDLLPVEIPESLQPYKILDVGSGPGSWPLMVASHFPAVEVVGIDISALNVKYANAVARAELKSDQVSFEEMDATKPLNFLDASFDLINARAINGFLHRHSWFALMDELSRIVRPGGIIRLVEYGVFKTNSPTFERFCAMVEDAMANDPGRFADALEQLPQFFEHIKFTDLQRKKYNLDFSLGSPAYTDCIEDIKVVLILFKPFLVHHGIDEQEYEQLCIQSLIEMQQPGFQGYWPWHAMWGRKPE